MPLELDSWYRRYGPMVLRRCRSLLRDEEKAVDAMHDVFVQLLRRSEHLDDAAPSSLMLRIATNVCLNRLRTERRHPEHPNEELLYAIASESDEDGAAAARSFLGRLFSKEQESTRVMAVMHLLDGLTLEEVAEEVGLSVSGVRKRLRTLKGKAADLLEAA